MGCGGSKNVEIRAQTRGSPDNNGDINTDTQENEFNVFEHSANNNELGGLCANAKPRLRSAIRRGSDIIKPVTSDENDNSNKDFDCDIKPPPLDLSDQALLSDNPFINRDSGFDSNRANSEASERAKSSVREETSSVATFSTMRPDSNLTGSVVTARDLNASFMTMSDDYMTQNNGDVSLDLDVPLEDHMKDFDDGHYRTFSNTPSRTVPNTPSRTLSNTPSARPLSSTPSRLVFSAEPQPIPLYPKNIDVIKEESEGGFTPRSLLDEVVTPRIKLEPPKKDFQNYYSDELLRSNQKVGWSARGIYKGMVYDASRVIDVFRDMHAEYAGYGYVKRKEEWLMERKNASFDDEEDEYEECEYHEEVKSFDDVYPKQVLNPTGSLTVAIKILFKEGIPGDVIEQHLTQCVIGELKPGFSSQHWEAFRKDVSNVNEDLIREDLRGQLSENTKDVMEQLQRWILKYGHDDPKPPKQIVGDPNIAEFDLPDGIRDNIDCLRRWLEEWERFDLEVPESGSWHVYEIEDIDLGDAQEIFEDSLRSHVDLINPFETQIDGEAGWAVLQPGIFADDVMTAEQLKTDESRRYRTDLHDTRRMERRRVKLLNYFVMKYELNESRATHFLQWSQAMEEGHKQFQILCENG